MVVVYVGNGDQTQGGAGEGPTEATQVDILEQEAQEKAEQKARLQAERKAAKEEAAAKETEREAEEGRGAKATPEKSRAGNEDDDRDRRSGGEQDGMSQGATPEKPGSAEPGTSKLHTYSML